MTPIAEKQVSYTLGTYAIENLSPSKDAIRFCEQISDGTLSADQAVEEMLQKYGISGDRSNG